MPRDKTRSSCRKPRRLTNFASDVEMLEVDRPRSSERLKQKGKNRPGFQGKHEEDRRSRVSKSTPTTQPLPGGLRGSQTARGSCATTTTTTTTTGRKNLRAHNNTNMTSTRARTTTAAAAAATIPLNPFAPRGMYRGRNTSVLSTLSAAQPGPWCDGCNRLNRQLHGYLLDVLRTGERAVDEWAYAVGASPDHMECEPAPERIIPEGYRRCSQQCWSCVAGGAAGSGSGSGFVTPPAPSGWAVAGEGYQGQMLGGYRGQLGVIDEAQVGGGGGPYAQAAAFPGATPDPPAPSPPGISAQVNHQLVAVPEGQNHHLLHARWAGRPAQAQQPWEASPHHGVAMPLTPPKEPGDDDNNRARARRVTPTPVHPEAAGGGGGFEGRVMQWGVPPR